MEEVWGSSILSLSASEPYSARGEHALEAYPCNDGMATTVTYERMCRIQAERVEAFFRIAKEPPTTFILQVL